MKLIVFLLAISSNALAKKEYHCFPQTDLKIPAKTMHTHSFFNTKSVKKTTGLTQLEFLEVVKKFDQFWSPILMNRYQKKLVFDNNWDEARVNASATRDDDNNPVIKVSGGLARHPDMTKNGMLLILCHELGHYLGGAPKSFRGKSKKRSWSSAEGQADYFATTKCMAKMARLNAIYPDVAPLHQSACQNETCLKILPAAISVGSLFASLRSDWEIPSPLRKSPENVRRTFYAHPTPQCRLDTFIAGSLCSEDFDIDFDNLDHKVGSCLKDIEPEAARPNCWFSHNKY